MTSYTPPSNKIIHVTSVDFVTRQISNPVLLVQYDDTLPILEVHLFQNGVKYNLSSTSNVNIRFKNLDGYKVYNPALGYNSSDTSIVYFTITQTMTVSYGKSFGVIEVGSGNGIANSAPISFVIDRNPIQISDIDASDDMQSIAAFVSQAQESAISASASASAASTSATHAGSSASSAASSSSAATSAANRANSSASAAASSATNAAASAAAAEEDASEIRNMRATANTLSPGSQASASYEDGLLTLGIPRGNTGSKGDTGNGIDSVALLSTSGRVKTYRITFTDGTHFDFSVTDGQDGEGSGTLNQITFNGTVYEDDGNGNVTINESSDDKTWNGVTLSKSNWSGTETTYVPHTQATSGTTAYYAKASYVPTAYALAKYNANAYLISTTPSANDNSTKVATTAYVDRITYTETDPTVPSWAKASSKPPYTASEVGAIANPETKSNGQVLTYNGTSGLWEAANSAGGRGAIFTGICNTEAETEAKVATLDDATGFSLTAGVRIAITFLNNNTATRPTLNVNNTGAKNIAYRDRQNTRYSGSGNMKNTWRSEQTVIFYYNGSSWVRSDSYALYSYQSEIVGDGESYGGGDKLFWLRYGLPVNSTSTVGGPYTPIYLNNGVFTPVSSSSLVTRTIGSDTTISSGGWRRVTYLTLTPGTWIVTMSFHTGSSSGVMECFGSINPEDGAVSYSSSIALGYMYAPSGQTPNLNLAGIATVTADTNMYLNIYGTKNIQILANGFSFKAARLF